MLIVPEALIAGLVSPEDAFAAVEATFAAMSRGEAYNFAVVREALGEGRQYGFKSGLDRSAGQLGVKAGGYFPGNAARGIINHQSTVFLFDPETGQPTAMVGGGLLTALRTAAASAISIGRLARTDAKVLGMVGAGHQAGFQLRAAARVRAFERVIAWNLHPDMLGGLARIAAELGLPFEAVSLERMVEADVIVTITSSPAASLLNAHVSDGTHLACMGTDTKGKQEVDPALLGRAWVFTDEVAQSVSIGEAQHAVALGLLDATAITPLGDVVTGRHPGRRSADEVTLFDGTGVGLQDLAVAAMAVRRAQERGQGLLVEV
ncbi:MAG: ornithine cyclodeaminase family protein [Pseudotabrizicola sp.]|uniref:iminosuccinate reductase BhcD n=1 Tax=Pseudotabrizicola sp. TaxID=2939647 RepID=UPI0027223969|nr:iminosuccinate reductase BhcD [Pseudotabrizicola sp.]MDO8884921.1 ornithine cyclodeaminase family protein [Pseudotabrizicola sp.]MDP2082365.1 ornithine cyclodeaminase family protein [Pseudotabrizicola sp.]MDZ7574308.1 ornithine cyclodeaminase family protein [Pseudotabrizicola sp.]